MNKNDVLQEPFSFTNAAHIHNKQNGLKKSKAYGEVKRTNRKNNLKKKMVKGVVYLSVFAGLIEVFSVANKAFNQTVDNKIASGEIDRVAVSYTPTNGPTTMYFDRDGNKVEIKFSDILETITDNLEHKNERVL